MCCWFKRDYAFLCWFFSSREPLIRSSIVERAENLNLYLNRTPNPEVSVDSVRAYRDILADSSYQRIASNYKKRLDKINPNFAVGSMVGGGLVLIIGKLMYKRKE